MTTMVQILPSVPDVGVTCHHLLERSQVHPKGIISFQLFCPHYTKLLMPFLMNPSQSCCHHPYMADRKRHWTALEISCELERDHAAQLFCGVRNITRTEDWSCISCLQTICWLSKGKGWKRSDQQPTCPICSNLMELQWGEGNISEGQRVWRKQWPFQSLTQTVSITVLSSSIWLLQFSSACLHNMYCQQMQHMLKSLSWHK